MKNFKILALTFLLGSFAQAQTLEEAIKKTDNERYEAADADFKQLIAKEPANSKLYFYYGENFFQHDDADLELAHGQWQKGLGIDPNCQLNTVGLGKYQWYKGDTTAGRANFNKALAATKNKNAEVMRQIAKVLVNAPKKDLKGAVALMTTAIKLEPKNIENHLILGDAQQLLNPSNGSLAIKSYNDALGIDPKSAKAIVRTAELYKRAKNYSLANDKFKEAQAADPTYAPAYRLNGELNIQFNKSAAAVENYTKYLELNNSVEARYRYATALFTGKNYCEAIPELENIESKGFSNLYTKRMLAYSIYECNEAGEKTPENYKRALAESDKFFATAAADKVIAEDYSKKGTILSRLGNDSLAIIELDKAIAVDPSSAGDLYTDMARIYTKNKQYDKVISTFEKKANGNYAVLNAQENLDLGKAYYFGPMDYVKADSSFARLNRLSPSYAAGFIWKGRSSYKLEDPKNIQYAAQPAYEQFVTLLTEEDKANPAYKSFIIEAAKYLGDYYVNSKMKDTEKAKVYWGMVQTLDPADKQAKAFFASPAGK